MKLSLPMLRTEWLQKPVAIFGRGESGEAAANLVLHLGGTCQFFSEDASGNHPSFDVGEASRCDLVVFSPGFPLDHSWLRIAREAGCEVVTEVEFARRFWTGKVWTVSGTNGKTTTVSLLTHALQYNGQRAVAVGNIGKAFSRAVLSADNRADAVAVCEVSSFQSEAFTHWTSDAGIWTHFSANHLDRHGSMENYFLAKCRAFVGIPQQSLFLGRKVLQAAQELRLIEHLPAGCGVLDLELEEDTIPSFFQTPAQRDNFSLCASLFISMGGRLATFLDSLASFSPPAHRIAHVQTILGIDFWNDSKATNSAAVRAALEQFAGRRIHWIGGGLSKGESLAYVAREIVPWIAKAYTIGSTGEELADELRQVGGDACYDETLDRAVEKAFSEARAGDIVLLSPGFASFDQFGGYAERGECFRNKVFHLSSSSEVIRNKALIEETSSLNTKNISQKTEL